MSKFTKVMSGILLAVGLGGSAFSQEAPAPPAASATANASATTRPQQAKTAEAAVRAGDGWSIHWQLDVIALPAKKALLLLPELGEEGTIAAGWKEVQAMVEQGGAEVVENDGGQVLSGVETTSSQGEILRYGLEFDAPQFIESLEVTRRSIEPTRPQMKIENTPLAFGPTIFELHQLGTSFTMTARASEDGKLVEVTSRFERTWLAGWDETEVGRLPNNEKILIKQPRFAEVNKVSVNGLFSGERVLLSAHRVPDSGAKMELAFLRVWTTSRKAPINK